MSHGSIESINEFFLILRDSHEGEFHLKIKKNEIYYWLGSKRYINDIDVLIHRILNDIEILF